MTTSKKNDLDELLANADEAATGLVGQTRVEHLLDTALVHALAGNKKEAEELIDKAKTEATAFSGLDHPSIKRGFLLAEAKVRALL